MIVLAPQLSAALQWNVGGWSWSVVRVDDRDEEAGERKRGREEGERFLSASLRVSFKGPEKEVRDILV